MTAQIKVFKPQQSSRAPGRAVGTETLRQLGLVKDHAELVKQIHRGFPYQKRGRIADDFDAAIGHLFSCVQNQARE
ncbi:MAG: hypothetical protein L0Y58_10135 [Verrucomicrobia subdivision 3 bacterium]|nr:hypothetical protein [Limisphaerales bacterium]